MLFPFQAIAAAPPAIIPEMSGEFVRSPASLALQKPLGDAAPISASSPWTMNCWVWIDRPQQDSAIIAGFGDGEDMNPFTVGRERFITSMTGGLKFWGCGRDLPTKTPLDLNRWQMITVTYDGTTVRMFKNGESIGQKALQFADAAGIAHLAPNPQSHLPRFLGKIADFQIWNSSFSEGQIKDLLSDRDKILAMEIPLSPGGHEFEATKPSVIGKVAPQPRDTLPVSATPIVMPAPLPRVAASPEPTDWKKDTDLTLNNNWTMVEAPKITATAADMSKPDFLPTNWFNATVPGTVLTTLVANGVYPDPYFGLNNTAIPETLCHQDYWYRTMFRTPASDSAKHTRLTFKGINYAAEVWLNGNRLGDIHGAFIRGSFDITAQLKDVNVLLVKVSPPPHPGVGWEKSLRAGVGCNGGALCQDGPTFISSEGWDWVPAIKDRDTGIWQDVGVRQTGPVELGDAHVVTTLPLPDTSRADVTINAEVHNATKDPQTGVLAGSIENIAFETPVELKPGETRTITFDPKSFKQLTLQHPRLWWPNGSGKPELYQLQLKFIADDKTVSDHHEVRFGVRQFTYSKEPHLTIAVNGHKIMVRGGDWGMDDAMKRVSRERLEPYIRLHRDANLNLIRNWTGECDEETFYDLCDEYGIMVWNDFWISSTNTNMEPADPDLFLSNAKDVIVRFRNHPCIAVWCGRNEGTPPAIINKPLAAMLQELDGTRYYQPNSRQGDVMSSGPWRYRDPKDYYSFKNPDRGFTTELGMPSVPTVDAMKAMMPATDLWPISDTWSYHDMHEHVNGGTYLRAIDEMFGPATGIADFDRKAQMLNYANHRAMYEGWNSDLLAPCSGIIIWMSHPAWPSTMWQLYSSDYEPDAGLFAVKKACEPVHVQLNLANGDVQIINNTFEPIKGLKTTAQIFDTHSKLLGTSEQVTDAAPSRCTKAATLNWPTTAGPAAYLVKLQLHGSAGELISDNFYWFAKTQSDLQHLNEIPDVQLEIAAKSDAAVTTVQLKNPTDRIALLAHLTLRDAKTHARILPVYYDDNYISLLPGEVRKLRIDSTGSHPDGLAIGLDGYNVPEQIVGAK